MGRIGHLRTTHHDAISAADSARDRGRWMEAAQKYQEAVRRHEHRADLKVQLGNCLKESGRHLEAYRAYVSSLSQNSCADVYLQLGHLLKVSGNFYSARDLYKNAAAMGDETAAAELDAFPTVNPAIIRDPAGMRGPDDAPSGVERPQVFAVLRHLAKVEQNPTDPERLRTAAYVLLDLGYRDDARAFFELSFLFAARTPETQLMHADIVVRTGLWSADTVTGLTKAYWSGAARQRLRELVRITLADARIGQPAPIVAAQDLHQRVPLRTAARDDVSAKISDVLNVAMPEVIGPPTIRQRSEYIINLVRQAHVLLFSGASDNTGAFADLLDHVFGEFSDHPIFISFASPDGGADISEASCRTLLNCLSAWVASSSSAYLGPFASRHLVSALGMSTSNPVLEWILEGGSLEDNVQSILEMIDDILQDGAHAGASRLIADRCLAALLSTCVCAAPLPSLESLSRFLVKNEFGFSAYLVYDQIFQAGNSVNQEELVYAAQKIKHAGSSACALALLNKFSNEDRASVNALCEKAIVSKVCGDFQGAARLFQKCIEREPGNLFHRHELWSILPEIEDISDVLERYRNDDKFLDFAGARLNYRMRLRRWEFDDGEQKIADDVPLHEIAPEIASEFVSRQSPAMPEEQIQVLQLGWKERITRFGKVRELRRIEVIRAKARSETDVVGLRIRIDGRTISYDACDGRPPKPITEGGKKTFLFNCWVDLSEVGRGLHEMQLVFEQRDSGYFTREELVFVDPGQPSEGGHFSGATVRLESLANAPLDERVNSMPSTLLSARRSFFSGPFRRILIVRADQLGDFVTSLPAILRLRDIFKDAELCCLVTPQNRDIARSLNLFAKVFFINLAYDHTTKRRFASLAEQVRLRKELRHDAFDLAIDLSPGSDTRPLLRLANARYRVGFKPDQFRWLSFGVDIQTRDDVNAKEGASHATLVSALVEAVAGALKHRPHIVKSQIANWEALKKFGILRDSPFVVLHSGARLSIKRWPVSHYTELARMTAVESNLYTVLFLENSDDLVFLNDMDIPADRFHVIAGPVTFEELDSLLSLCTVFVGNDTGPKHLAALRGVPVVSIHMGQVNWDEWGQEGDGVIITRNVPCYGCGIEDADDCGKGLACLVHIKPREAYEAVLSLLKPETRPGAVDNPSDRVAPGDEHVRR